MTGPAWVLLASTIVLAVFCQFYRVRAQVLAEEVLNAHDWVDQIIEALQEPDGEASQERVAGLVDQQRTDGRAG